MTNTNKQSTTQGRIEISHESSDLFKVLETVKSEGRVIASNKEVDTALQSEKLLHPVWTGTVLVYEAPGKAFGKQVISESLTFEVPEKYQELKDCALVLEHPNFTIEKGELLNGKVSKVIRDFPALSGWYDVDNDTGIPYGRKVSSEEQSTRYLWRPDRLYISAVVRRPYGFYSWRDIYAYCRPDFGFRVAYVSKLSQNVITNRSAYELREIKAEGMTIRKE